MDIITTIMKLLLIPVTALVAGVTASAAIIQIDISPTGRALSTTNYLADQDHAVGLSGRNEAPPNPGPATGNELGAGTFYDDVSNVLTLKFAYGSAFGFVDLIAPFTAAHIHQAPSSFPLVNTPGGVVIPLGAGIHFPAGPFSGMFTGSLVLTPLQETALMSNLLYVNIHSAARPGGEIRGQLIPVPETSCAALAVAGAGLLARRRRTSGPPGAGQPYH